MNSAPHLLNEDRQEFTRILDEALRSAAHRRDLQDLTEAGGTLTTEQLRSMALSATALITAPAAAEYQRYIRLRGELRSLNHTNRVPRRRRRSQTTRTGRAPTTAQVPDDVPALNAARDQDAAAAPDTTRTPDAARLPGTASGPGIAGGPAIAGGSDTTPGPGTAGSPSGDRAQRGGRPPGGAESGEPAGAGLAAVIAVLAPVLAGAAAVIFLLVGYVLEMVGPSPHFANTLLTTGWVFGGIAAAAMFVAAVGLLLTALRNSSTSLRADDRAELDTAVDRAREAWQQALLQRGILPFLQEALVTSGPDRARATDTRRPGRMPHLGYHSPGFSSPDGGPAPAPRPRYSSPDFTSPDFGGPERQPE